MECVTAKTLLQSLLIQFCYFFLFNPNTRCHWNSRRVNDGLAANTSNRWWIYTWGGVHCACAHAVTPEGVQKMPEEVPIWFSFCCAEKKMSESVFTPVWWVPEADMTQKEWYLSPFIIPPHTHTHTTPSRPRWKNLDISQSSIKITIKGSCNEAEDLSRRPDFSLHECAFSSLSRSQSLFIWSEINSKFSGARLISRLQSGIPTLDFWKRSGRSHLERSENNGFCQPIPSVNNRWVMPSLLTLA